MTTFDDWPWQYSFPPFFTLQPNLATQKLQIKAWCELVLNYQRNRNSYVLDIREPGPLFNNVSIKRTLSPEGIRAVLDALSCTGNAEQADKTGNRWYVYWHTLDELASIVYSWIESTGQLKSVCTLYELINAPDTEFTNIDEQVLKKALKILENNGKAEIISFEDNNGVKFF